STAVCDRRLWLRDRAYLRPRHAAVRIGIRTCLARCDRGPGVGESRVQRMLRLPAELAPRERGVEDAPLELARPRRRELRLALDPCHMLNPSVQVEHRRLDA